MNTPILDDPILTTKQAAKMTMQQPMTLVKWRQRSKGPFFLRLGGKVRYRESDLIKWLEAARVNPADRKPKRRRGSK